MATSSEFPSARSSGASLREREQQIVSSKLRTAYKRARLQLVKTIESLEGGNESAANTSELANLILERTAARVAERGAKPTRSPGVTKTTPAHLIETHGGAYTAAQVASLLDISRQAVFTRRSQNQLLGVQLPSRRELLYPKWQFTEDGGVVAGLDEVLRTLGDAPAWSKFRFLTSGNYRLGEERPIELLRSGNASKRARVIVAAENFGEHGAA